MQRKYSDQAVNEILNNNGYRIIEKCLYQNKKSTILDSDGYKYYISITDILNTLNNNQHPFKFFKNNKYTIENIKLWINLENKEFSLLSEKYMDAHQKLEFECLNCHNIFKTSWNDISAGKGCSKCSLIKNGMGRRKPILDVIEIFNKNNITLLEPDKYVGCEVPLLSRCNKCGHKWYIRYSNVKSGYGCPKCNSSKGEALIKTFLDFNEIIYDFQKRFKDCRYIKTLPFDFYLPNHNICIEYDGELHYMENRLIDSVKAKKNFELTQKRDKIKTKYCKDNNIKLIRIPYWEKGNIEAILEKELL